MGTEIHRVRMIEAGRIRFEVECDDLNHFAAVANAAMAVVPEAYQPLKPGDYYAEAEARRRIAAEREAKREAAQTATGRQIPTNPMFPGNPMFEGRRIPTGHVPPYDTTLGGQPLPGGYLMADTEEPPLRAFTADECKPGGSI